MVAAPETVHSSHYVTLEEYLKIEEETGERYDWENGRIYNMAGAAYPHVTVTDNITRILGNQLRGKSCQSFSQDQRIKIPIIGRRTYPDVLIACPPFEWDEELPNTLLNPRVIIEVLSPSTKKFDRTNKLKWYGRIPSVTDYIMVASEWMEVTHIHRTEEGIWQISKMLDQPEEVVELDEYSCRQTLGEIYERLEFEKSADPSPIAGDAEAAV
jgi:Uma2 family endonuclease